MKINEVEQRVGITKKNIRYYEAEGLLKPSRNQENSYRDYSEYDILLLKKIRLLRRLGVPIEDIRKIINGGLTLSDALRRHEITLEYELRSLEQSAEMCRSIASAQVPFSDIDADWYLSEMDNVERQKGVKFLDMGAKDKRRTKWGAVLSAAAMVVLMGAVIAIFLWANTVERAPLGVLIFVVMIPAVVIAGVLLALKERFKQIERGEEDEASKY